MVLQIWKEIRAGKLAPLYLLYGKEQFLIDETKNLIIEQALGADEREFNLSSFDLEETPVETAIEDCQTVPFFGEKKVVIVHGAYFLSAEKGKDKVEHDLKALESYLSDPVPATSLVITAPYEKLDERKKITKTLLKTAVCLQAKPLTERETKKWIKEKLEGGGLSVTNGAVDLIYHYSGGNLSLLKNEVEKLLLYGSDGQVIEEKAVELLVSKSFEGNAFSLVDKVVRRRLEEALEIYNELLKQNEEPIKILAAIASQFRIIYQVKALTKRGYGQHSIAGQLKIHPYRVKLAIEQGENFTGEQLMEIINSLADIDYQMKTGFGNRERLLEMFFFHYLRI